ncbi:MAG: hypothetical protein ABRQ39_17345 [Candidatus Eremiobacterota bacterium]
MLKLINYFIPVDTPVSSIYCPESSMLRGLNYYEETKNNFYGGSYLIMV